MASEREQTHKVVIKLLVIKIVIPGIEFKSETNFTRISQSLIFGAEYYSGVEDPDRQ